MVLWNYSWLWPPLKILFTSLDPRQGAVSGTNLAAAQSAKHAKVQTLPMVQQNQDPFSFLGIVSVRQCMMALFTHNLVHANSKFPRLHDFLHWSNGQKVGQSGWASGHDLSILNSSYMYILIPPKWQDKISKSGTPRADEIFGCDIFGVLFKLYSFICYWKRNPCLQCYPQHYCPKDGEANADPAWCLQDCVRWIAEVSGGQLFLGSPFWTLALCPFMAAKTHVIYSYT